MSALLQAEIGDVAFVLHGAILLRESNAFGEHSCDAASCGANCGHSDSGGKCGASEHHVGNDGCRADFALNTSMASLTIFPQQEEQREEQQEEQQEERKGVLKRDKHYINMAKERIQAMWQELSGQERNRVILYLLAGASSLSIASLLAPEQRYFAASEVCANLCHMAEESCASTHLMQFTIDHALASGAHDIALGELVEDPIPMMIHSKHGSKHTGYEFRRISRQFGRKLFDPVQRQQDLRCWFQFADGTPNVVSILTTLGRAHIIVWLACVDLLRWIDAHKFALSKRMREIKDAQQAGKNLRRNSRRERRMVQG